MYAGLAGVGSILQVLEQTSCQPGTVTPATSPAKSESGALLTVPDPEEQDRDGTARHGSPENSADTDAAFASIVAGWQAEPDVPRWPAEDERENLPSGPPGKRMRDDADDDHFQPPEPPPLPRPRARTVGGVALLTVGLLLLVGPNVLGLGARVATPLGLLALTAGIGWLVIGLRSGPPPDGWDDGARL